jgi:NitT/TauT family transport system substrate-binding protein
MAALSLLSLSQAALAEPPPETTKIRLGRAAFICYAPQYLAEEFLRLEGFTDVEFVSLPPDYTYHRMVAEGGVDLAIFGPTSAIVAIDTGMPIVMVSGVHVGCWELFGNDRVRTIKDLKGKNVAVISMGAVDQLWIASILAYVGIHPVKEVSWTTTGKLSESMRLFLDGKVDAFLAFPPQPQEMRLKKAGRVLVNTTLDRPWSQYFCCMASMPKSFIERNPVAAKRALRALLKAADVCATDPERAAKYLVAKGYEPRYEIGLEVVKSLPYRWREIDPEDSIRFHALRLHEVGLIKSTPQKILAQGTDWRFLNALKG